MDNELKGIQKLVRQMYASLRFNRQQEPNWDPRAANFANAPFTSHYRAILD